MTPETDVSPATLGHVLSTVNSFIQAGLFDHLPRKEEQFVALSRSRSFSASNEMSEALLHRLQEMGLAQKGGPSYAVGLHPLVRKALLILLTQTAVSELSSSNERFYPITDQHDFVEAMTRFLSVPTLPSAGRVIEADFGQVGIDLTGVSVEEMMDFRAAHQKELRAYRRDLTQFIRDVDQADPVQRSLALEDRKQVIQDGIQGLRTEAFRRWGSRASYGLGMAGAAWAVKAGDILGGLLSGGAIITGAASSPKPQATAASFLYQAQRFVK